MQPKIKILHIIKSLGRGGAEMLLPETLFEHNKENFEFHYIYFLPWKDQMVSALEENGGVVKCFSAKNNMAIIMQAPKIASYIKTHKIQLVHCHLPWAGIVGRLAGKFAKVPVIYTEHNKWERYHKLTFTLNKLTFHLQKTAVAVSGDVAESIKKFYNRPQPQVDVILNGVNTAKFSREVKTEYNLRQRLGIAENTIVIGTVSVFRTQKRLLTWLEIAKAIHHEFPNTYFIVVGDGLLKDEIHKKAGSLDMSSYLHFAGLQTEVRPYYEAMNYFMMSSEFEGLPIALLEAMSMECIPACTNAGGIGEVINHKQNGLLTEVATPHNLKDLIIEAIKAPANVTQAMAKNARESIINHFSIQKMVKALEELYINTFTK